MKIATTPIRFLARERAALWSPAEATESQKELLYRLLVLNMALQLFDGVATYQGLMMGFQEANPVLIRAFEHIGVLQTLALYKTYACALLVVLHQVTSPRLGILILRGLAAVYCLFSLGPWLGKFASVMANLL